MRSTERTNTMKTTRHTDPNDPCDLKNYPPDEVERAFE